tara:strand:- start:9446 stop:9847 length:402 start_codon:yes stop_codon:yes gene_type:complete
MAQIHGAAFTRDRGWSVEEFTDFLSHPYVGVFAAEDGFALTRTLAGESELLTIAVAPDRQQRGIARDLLARWLHAVTPIAETAFLEVAADNSTAIALYERAGFSPTGMRKAYYHRTDGPPVDAVLMSRALTRG